MIECSEGFFFVCEALATCQDEVERPTECPDSTLPETYANALLLETPPANHSVQPLQQFSFNPSDLREAHSHTLEIYFTLFIILICKKKLFIIRVNYEDLLGVFFFFFLDWKLLKQGR